MLGYQNQQLRRSWHQKMKGENISEWRTGVDKHLQTGQVAWGQTPTVESEQLFLSSGIQWSVSFRDTQDEDCRENTSSLVSRKECHCWWHKLGERFLSSKNRDTALILLVSLYRTTASHYRCQANTPGTSYPQLPHALHASCFGSQMGAWLRTQTPWRPLCTGPCLRSSDQPKVPTWDFVVLPFSENDVKLVGSFGMSPIMELRL